MRMSFVMLPSRTMTGAMALAAGLMLASTSEIGVPLIFLGGVLTLAMPPSRTPSPTAVYV